MMKKGFRRDKLLLFRMVKLCGPAHDWDGRAGGHSGSVLCRTLVRALLRSITREIIPGEPRGGATILSE